jgi:hypothetical protein
MLINAEQLTMKGIAPSWGKLQRFQFTNSIKSHANANVQ